MKKLMRKFIVFALCICSLLGTFSVASADKGAGVSGDTALMNLKSAVRKGDYMCATYNRHYDFKQKKYKNTGGGYTFYTELTTGTEAENKDADYFTQDKFSALTADSKRKFLGDCFTIANAMAADTASGNSTLGVDESTVEDFYSMVQNQTGMGSQLLATLLQDTKPDYVTATRIYKPFSGVVGVCLGFLSIAIMSLLGLTMALDIAFITIPAFQLVMESEGSDGGQKAKGMSKIISIEARRAVEEVDNGGGSGGQNGGGKKAAIGIYFKSRWKGLVLLAICLLYLVQGQIWSLVSWIIDLLSGFIGF